MLDRLFGFSTSKPKIVSENESVLHKFERDAEIPTGSLVKLSMEQRIQLLRESITETLPGCEEGKDSKANISPSLVGIPDHQPSARMTAWLVLLGVLPAKHQADWSEAVLLKTNEYRELAKHILEANYPVSSTDAQPTEATTTTTAATFCFNSCEDPLKSDTHHQQDGGMREGRERPPPLLSWVGEDESIPTQSSEEEAGEHPSWQAQACALLVEIERDTPRALSGIHVFHQNGGSTTKPGNVPLDQDRHRVDPVKALLEDIVLYDSLKFEAASLNNNIPSPPVNRSFCIEEDTRNMSVLDGGERLRRILFIYSQVEPVLSYTQGMNEIAAHLLYVINQGFGRDEKLVTLSAKYPLAIEAVVFWALLTMLETLRDSFVCKKLQNHGLNDQMRRMMFLLQMEDNTLYRHLVKLEIYPTLFALSWFGTLFTHVFVLPDLLHFWDTLLCVESKHRKDFLVASAVAIVLLLNEEETLLDCDFAESLHVLQKETSSLDADAVIRLSYLIFMKRFTGLSNG